jgi:hypothetical protein
VPETPEQFWDDVLPPTPGDVWRANLELVRAALDGEAAGT